MTTAPPELETVVINGFTFSYLKRYFAGHECTQAEAAILNQALKRNLRKNFADQVPTEYVPEAQADEIYRAFREYEVTYTFGGPDPIHAEAFVIALEVAKRQLKAKGKFVSDFTRAQLNGLADEVLNGPNKAEILATARARVITIQAAAAREVREGSDDV